jgi:hypothetical protein
LAGQVPRSEREKKSKRGLTSDTASVILFVMGYLSKVQVIERANRTRQFYLICPAPLAEALELQKGEDIEWVVEDKTTLVIKRPQAASPRRSPHGR